MNEIDWTKIRDDYDRLHGQIRSRSKRSLKTDQAFDPEYVERRRIERIKYAISQIEGSWMSSTFEGTVRCNIGMYYEHSSDHIANVIIRQYRVRIYPFMTPFRPSEFVPKEVWEAMIRKVDELKLKVTDEWELFDRYNDLTGDLIVESPRVTKKKRMFGLTYEILSLED